MGCKRKDKEERRREEATGKKTKSEDWLKEGSKREDGSKIRREKVKLLN